VLTDVRPLPSCAAFSPSLLVAAGDAAPAAKRSRADDSVGAASGSNHTPATVPPKPAVVSSASAPVAVDVPVELKGTSMDLSQPLYGSKMAPVRVSVGCRCQ